MEKRSRSRKNSQNEVIRHGSQVEHKAYQAYPQLPAGSEERGETAVGRKWPR